MKTILVLTDASNTGSCTAEACVMLGSKLHANLLLFSTYVLVPVTAYYAGAPWIDEGVSVWETDTKAKLKLLSFRLQSLTTKLGSEDYKPTIHMQIAEGELGSNVASYIQKKKIEMVVMGAKSGTPLEHILLGSDTRAVINQSHRPILIIPKKSILDKIEKVTFASNFDPGEIEAIKYLVTLGNIFNFHLEIIHVQQFGEQIKPKPQVMAFAKLMSGLHYKNLSYTTIRGKNVVQRLSRYCRENKSDVLAFMHHQNNFFGRLLQKSTTKAALSGQQIPLLVIPSRLD